MCAYGAHLTQAAFAAAAWKNKGRLKRKLQTAFIYATV
jgi:hypothetical protein